MLYTKVETLPFPENAEVVGIGKAILKTETDKNYNIPHLHFLVFKGFSKDGILDAVNLEYGLHGRGKNGELALENTIDMVIDYFSVNQIDSRKKFTEIIKSQDNHILSDYWRVYRKTKMKLAIEKRDLGSGMEEDLLSRIQNNVSRLVQENVGLQKENADLNDETVPLNRLARQHIEQRGFKNVQYGLKKVSSDEVDKVLVNQ